MHIGAWLDCVKDAVLAVTGSAAPNCRLAHPSPECCRYHLECFPDFILSLITEVSQFKLSVLALALIARFSSYSFFLFSSIFRSLPASLTVLESSVVLGLSSVREENGMPEGLCPGSLRLFRQRGEWHSRGVIFWKFETVSRLRGERLSREGDMFTREKGIKTKTKFGQYKLGSWVLGKIRASKERKEARACWQG